MTSCRKFGGRKHHKTSPFDLNLLVVLLLRAMGSQLACVVSEINAADNTMQPVRLSKPRKRVCASLEYPMRHSITVQAGAIIGMFGVTTNGQG